MKFRTSIPVHEASTTVYLLWKLSLINPRSNETKDDTQKPNHATPKLYTKPISMSYYFAIVNTRDSPLFELEFGTSKQGGDGVPRFSSDARKMNPFIVHAALDYVDELQWTNTAMYTRPEPSSLFPIF